MAAVVAIALGGIVLGAVVAVSLNGIRLVGDHSASPAEGSSAASTVVEETGKPPSPTEAINPSPTAAATIPPLTPTAAPTQLMLTGTWEPIRPEPDPHGLHPGGAVLLPDGRIVVTHWYRFEDHGDCLAVYDPRTDSWQIPELIGPPGWTGCLESHSYARIPDGRLYNLVFVIDPTVKPWRVDYTGWRAADHLPNTMGTTTDGRLYGPTNGCLGDPCRARLYELHPESGTIAPISDYRGPHNLDWVVGGRGPRLYIGGEDNHGTRNLASYDPVSGTWREEPSAPFPPNWDQAGLGPMGWLYVQTAYDTSFAENVVWALTPGGDWYQVELPTELRTNWSPVFVNGGDGRLYAFDAKRPYAFTPAGVAPVPIE